MAEGDRGAAIVSRWLLLAAVCLVIGEAGWLFLAVTEPDADEALRTWVAIHASAAFVAALGIGLWRFTEHGL